jgi:UDPglucose 6-dehydrogenase
VLGLTFKPNTDDMREAPSIALITGLQDLGAMVRAYDPAGMDQARALLCDVVYCDDAYSCAEGAHALVVVTEWEQFRALDFARLERLMAPPRRGGPEEYLSRRRGGKLWFSIFWCWECAYPASRRCGRG